MFFCLISVISVCQIYPKNDVHENAVKLKNNELDFYQIKQPNKIVRKICLNVREFCLPNL